MDAQSVPDAGRIVTEHLGHVFAIGIDRPKKLNGFSPKMLGELAQAFTAFEDDENAWVGLLFAEGDHFTAGLELDKVAPVMRERGSVFPVGSIDPLSLRPPLRSKPLVCAVQGICFTLGIELMLNAVNINLAAFWRYGNVTDMAGQVFAIIVFAVAAAEVAVGLALVISVYRKRNTVIADEIDMMKF